MNTDNLTSEHDVEIWVEHQIDRLDRKYALGRITPEEYDQMMDDIDYRAECMMKQLAGN